MQNYRLKELPIVSVGLVVLNCVIFLMGELIGDEFVNRGVLYAWSVFVDGEYWRVITAMFLHGGIQHIFNNMLILFFLGGMIEKEIGHVSIFLIYMLSGIGGNLLSLYMKYQEGSLVGSLGASGAVFGLDGVLLALVLFSRMQNLTMSRVIASIALSLYSGFTGGNIDNAAHLGGLFTGFLAGVIWCLIHTRKRIRRNDFEY